LHDQLILGVEPDRLSALRLGRGWRTRVLGHRVVRVAATGAPGTDGEEVMTAMRSLLAEADWGGHDISVILSSHYVHYAVVPEARGLSAIDKNALVQLLFRETFGDMSNDWELRISPSPNGMATLSSGISRNVLAAVHRACIGQGQLRSIRPSLMSVFNTSRSRIANADGCLALVESGRITLSSFEKGAWKSVTSRAAEGQTLPQLLQDEDELFERNLNGRLWLCDLTGAAALPSASSWRCERLQPSRGLSRGRLSNAPNGELNLAGWGAE